MFRSALTKLTLIYLLIIMAISLFFSFSIYKISTLQLQDSFKKQQITIEKRIMGPRPKFLTDPTFLAEREKLLTEGKENIFIRLVYTNLVILVLGGAVSYILAQRTLAPIEEAHESQARFASDASHELRSPLAAMKSEIEVALRDKNLTKEEAKVLLASNLEEVERLKKLSEGLLELARENGASQNKEKIAVGKVVEAAIKNLTKDIAQKELEVTSNLKASFVFGNKDSLIQLVTIILDNAVKYSEKGKKITIAIKEQGQKVMIEISDEGPGIKKEDLPYIFDRFYRADVSRTKNKITGYGLGLSIAKKLVQLSNGEITVKSELKKGSTFTIFLQKA